MAKTKLTPDQDEYVPEGDLVIPNEVAPSGHGGTGPAPLPHPLTPEANAPAAPGEVNEPNQEEVPEEDRT